MPAMGEQEEKDLLSVHSDEATIPIGNRRTVSLSPNKTTIMNQIQLLLHNKQQMSDNDTLLDAQCVKITLRRKTSWNEQCKRIVGFHLGLEENEMESFFANHSIQTVLESVEEWLVNHATAHESDEVVDLHDSDKVVDLLESDAVVDLHSNDELSSLTYHGPASF